MSAEIQGRARNLYMTASAWSSTTVPLLAGEIGFESDTNKFKIGNGVAIWNALPYASVSEVLAGIEQNFYLSGQSAFAADRPASDVSVAISLVNDVTTQADFTYTAPLESTFNTDTSFYFMLRLTGLVAGTQYRWRPIMKATVNSTDTIIAEIPLLQALYFTPTTSVYEIFVKVPAAISASFTAPAGTVFTISVRVGKSTTGTTESVYLATDIATGKYVYFQRGGGFLPASRVYDLEDNVPTTQADINSARCVANKTVTDANSIVKSGAYDAASTASHIPSSSYAWKIFHMGDATNAVQTAVAVTNTSYPIQYIRTLVSGVWGTWRTYDSTGDGLIDNANVSMFAYVIWDKYYTVIAGEDIPCFSLCAEGVDGKLYNLTDSATVHFKFGGKLGISIDAVSAGGASRIYMQGQRVSILLFKSGVTLTLYKPYYIGVTINSDNSWTPDGNLCTIGGFVSGHYYIFLGYPTNTSQFVLPASNPYYYYDGTNLIPFTVRALTLDSSAVIAESQVSGLVDDLAAKISSSEKAANNGVATLDSGGKIPASQLPNSVMEYKGNWDASTNTPALADGTGNAGDVYRVSVAGSQTFNSVLTDFAVGDEIIYSGSVWEKSVNSENKVLSVNNQTGVVELDAADVGAEPTITTKNTAFNTNFGTEAGSTCQGNDSRLSDARTPSDSSVAYGKVADSLKTYATLANGTVDLSAAAGGKITLSANTAFSFSNFQLNKTYLLIVTANGYTPSFSDSTKHVLVEGNATLGTSGVFYISLTCIDATSGSEKLLTTIMKGA